VAGNIAFQIAELILSQSSKLVSSNSPPSLPMIKSSKQNGAIASGLLANRNAKDSGHAVSDSSIESFENAYAEASQARTVGKRPVPLAHCPSEDGEERQVRNVGLETVDGLSRDQHTEPNEAQEKSDRIESNAVGEPPKQPSAIVLPRMMTDVDVATYLSMSRSKIWRLCRREPTFPQPVRIAGSTRWDRTAIDLYLDGLPSSKSSGR
jgi:predicted DNA-binding transcriptional regulator AlpA